MPEGDSVYRFAGRLRHVLEGREILRARAHGPGPVPRIDKVVGATCTGVDTHGKNLFIHFDNALVLRGHLRMYGSWHVYRPDEAWRLPERDARLVLEVDGATVVNFNAPVIELIEERALALHVPISDARAGPARRRVRRGGGVPAVPRSRSGGRTSSATQSWTRR